MSSWVKLRAADGFELGAYRADPPGAARGRVVVLQEIFGVNPHIRAVCDRLAQVGYAALAPALFDRLQPGFESGYSPEEIAHARELIPKLDWAKLMLDVEAAADTLRRQGPVAVLGFCMGGTVAFLAATEINGLTAAVAYYGGQIIRHSEKRLRCPVQMHFGELDDHIPMSDVEKIRKNQTDAEVYVYPGARHGFNCDERASYDAESATLAWKRTLAFLDKAFGDAGPVGDSS